MLLRVNLDREVGDRLRESATAELRPIPLQAEVLLRRALALPVPVPPRLAINRACDDDRQEAVSS